MVARIKATLQPRILQDSNQGGQRSRFSYLPGWIQGRSEHQADPGQLDQAVWSNPAGCTVDPEDPGFLPGTNQATKTGSIQHFPGLALAWGRRDLEKNMSRTDTLVHGSPGYSEALLEPENSSQEMAGRDPESKRDEK